MQAMAQVSDERASNGRDTSRRLLAEFAPYRQTLLTVLGLVIVLAVTQALGSVWLKFQSQRMMQATCTAAKN